jgi:hypothetical protein
MFWLSYRDFKFAKKVVMVARALSATVLLSGHCTSRQQAGRHIRAYYCTTSRSEALISAILVYWKFRVIVYGLMNTGISCKGDAVVIWMPPS